MKPTLRKSFPQPEYSFVVRKDAGKNIRTDWHYHPDYEIGYIKRSKGTWLIGDHVGSFKSGDIVLMGPNLPHAYRHDPNFIVEPYHDKQGEVIAILFLKEILGTVFWDLPETNEIKKILLLTRKGVQLTGKAKVRVGKIIENTLHASIGRRLVNLVNILQIIADENEYKVLSSDGFACELDRLDNARISTIVEYTFNNYQNQITIEDIAALINMNKYSFCRFFKDKTKKTYIQFLKEVRVGKACRLLIEEDMNIAEICYTCGYNSISHFNHQFKALKHKSPYEYKQDFISHLAVL